MQLIPFPKNKFVFNCVGLATTFWPSLAPCHSARVARSRLLVKFITLFFGNGINLKNIFFYFLAPFFFLQSEEIEVKLKTQTPLKSAYLSQINLFDDASNWKYVDELRDIIEFDLNVGAFLTVLPIHDPFENVLKKQNKAHIQSHFYKERIPYVFYVTLGQNSLEITAYHIEKGFSKRYVGCPITKNMNEDRIHLHKLVDTIHKDLFGIQGISSMRIIYSQKEMDRNGDPISEIWMADYDGSNIKQMTFENVYCLTPFFFPTQSDQTQFGFVSYKNGQSKIYTSSDQNPFIELRGSQVLPALHPNQKQIAFITDAAGRPDLFIQNLNASGKCIGKARQLFTYPRATQASPTFSPDGKKIAFVSDKDGPPRIYCLDISKSSTQKTHPKLITKKNRENISPAWSPNGKKIAYSAKIGDTRQIWIYDLDTEEEMQLTTGPENKENPSWAPDSIHLIYNTDQEGVGQIYLIDLFQQKPIQITHGNGIKRFASFETRRQEFVNQLE